MRPSTCKWVIVDDSDLGIRYNGPESSSGWWNGRKAGDLDGEGSNGPTYLQTLHEFGGEGHPEGKGSIQFSYNGTSAALFGSLQTVNSTSAPDPTVSCFFSAGSARQQFLSHYTDSFQNRWELCEVHDLADHSYTLTMEVNVTPGTSFMFDYIAYCPSVTESLAGKTLYYDFRHPELSKWIQEPHWAQWDDNGMYTSVKDVPFEFEFEGTSLSWYTAYGDSFPDKPTTGSYAVDDKPYRSFEITGRKGSTASLYNQLLFQTPEYAAGKHTLKVKFDGDSGTAPLLLQSFMVKNGDYVGGDSPTASVSVTSASSTLQDLGATRSASVESPSRGTLLSAGGLAGIVIACVLTFVLCCILGIYCLRRRSTHFSNPSTPPSCSSSWRPDSLPTTLVPNTHSLSNSTISKSSISPYNTLTGMATNHSVQHSHHPSISSLYTTPQYQDKIPAFHSHHRQHSSSQNFFGIVSKDPFDTSELDSRRVLARDFHDGGQYLGPIPPPRRSQANGMVGESKSVTPPATPDFLLPPRLPTMNASARHRLIQHEDSGVRCMDEPEGVIHVETPPDYSRT